MSKKFFLPFLATLALVAGLEIGLNLVRQPVHISTFASANLVDLSLSPSTITIYPQDTITVNITINSQSYKVTAVNLGITYPADKFDALSFTPGDFLPNILTTASISNGSAHIELDNGTSGKQGSGVLATLTLKAKATGQAPISFDSTQIAGIDSNGNAMPTNILGDANPTTLTISSSPPGEPNSCGGTCGSNYNCKINLFCYQGFCRNPFCETSVSCVCPSPAPTPIIVTPRPSPTPEVVEWTPEPFISTPTPTPALTPTSSPLEAETQTPKPPFPYLLVIGISITILGIIFLIVKMTRHHPPLDTPPIPPAQ